MYFSQMKFIDVVEVQENITNLSLFVLSPWYPLNITIIMKGLLQVWYVKFILLELY